jgi:NAD(P)-dependent dehydrogenase (short-subunit alcohol dehydrogenase family)
VAGIDPERLADALRVLAEAERLPPEHPDAVAVRRATGRLFKAVKEQRRAERRAAVRENDEAVTAATATAAPGRIDDETRGRAIAPAATGQRAGVLQRARACYVCKQRYREVDAFYHQLCPPCAARNHERRSARTDLRGRRALLTGGRAKIGMYIALRLLRDGAHTTITTRFPRDAARRFAAMDDSEEWLDRLRVVGADLRDPRQVLAVADEVAAAGPLDVLINNAAQTVRRSPEAYAHLAAAERAALPEGALPELVTIAPQTNGSGATLPGVADTVGTAVDAGGLKPDLHPHNSWSQVVDEVDPVELLEVQLCNQTAPFLLVSRLRRSLASSTARRTYVVNVSAMEGQFARGYKGPGHPHTNMAKAALNMLTRTSASELLETDGILMTSVDTGWITDERPHPTKMRLAEAGFHAPLDLVDGAARVYDPIVRGEAGEDLHGVFLKDYEVAPW